MFVQNIYDNCHVIFTMTATLELSK